MVRVDYLIWNEERVADLINITTANWGPIAVKLSSSYLTLPDETSLSLPASYLVYPQGPGGCISSTLPPGTLLPVRCWPPELSRNSAREGFLEKLKSGEPLLTPSVAHTTPSHSYST